MSPGSTIDGSGRVPETFRVPQTPQTWCLTLLRDLSKVVGSAEGLRGKLKT